MLFRVRSLNPAPSAPVVARAGAVTAVMRTVARIIGTAIPMIPDYGMARLRAHMARSSSVRMFSRYGGRRCSADESMMRNATEIISADELQGTHGYSQGTLRVLYGYSQGTHRVLYGYSQGTRRVLTGSFARTAAHATLHKSHTQTQTHSPLHSVHPCINIDMDIGMGHIYIYVYMLHGSRYHHI